MSHYQSVKRYIPGEWSSDKMVFKKKSMGCSIFRHGNDHLVILLKGEKSFIKEI